MIVKRTGRILAAVTLVASALLLVACGPGELPDVTITIVDHTDALSDQSGDALFTITVREASESLAFGDLLVIAKYQTDITEELVIEHVDKDEDAQLEAGDEISCAEGGADVFNTSHVNAEVLIFLDRFNTGLAAAEEQSTTVASGIWTPDN